MLHGGAMALREKIMRNNYSSLGYVGLTLLAGASFPFPSFCAQESAFTYQGRLCLAGQPASGSFDMTFALFGADTGGVPVAIASTNNAVAISNGLFAASLDFGTTVFNGHSYWLEIGIATNGGGAFSAL